MNLQELSKQVIADKMLKKNLENYVAGGDRSLLNVTSFNNTPEISVSPDIKAKLEEKPELEKMLKELFESKVEIKVSEEKDNKTEDSENSKQQLFTVSDKGMGKNLPKLVCPFKDKKRGWNKSKARDQVLLYLNLLDYGHGGKRSLLTTKHKKAEKPEFWPDSISFIKYDHPSSATMSENEDLIESILHFFDYKVETHCNFPTVESKPRKATKKKVHVADVNNSLEEEQNKDEESSKLDKTTEENMLKQEEQHIDEESSNHDKTTEEKEQEEQHEDETSKQKKTADENPRENDEEEAGTSKSRKRKSDNGDKVPKKKIKKTKNKVVKPSPFQEGGLSEYEKEIEKRKGEQRNLLQNLGLTRGMLKRMDKSDSESN